MYPMHPVVYLLSPDLLNEENKDRFIKSLKIEQQEIVKTYSERKKPIKLLSIEEARNNKIEIDWINYLAPVPKFTGIKVFDDYSIKELIEYIDWTPFFSAWELKGKYPDILSNEKYGKQAQKLYDDAQVLLQKIAQEKLLKAKGIFGIFPANSVDDDIEVYTDECKNNVLSKLYNLRQQVGKAKGKPNYCLSDFIAPKSIGQNDWIGSFCSYHRYWCEKFS